MTYPQRDMHIHIFKRAHTHTHAHTYAHHIYIVGDPENLFLSFTHTLSHKCVQAIFTHIMDQYQYSTPGIPVDLQV